jgi:hypothetical protein
MTTPEDRRNIRIQGVSPDGAGECAICLEPIPDGVAGVAVLVGRRGPELEPAGRFQLCVTCCERIDLAGKVAVQVAALVRQKGTSSC